VLLKVVNAQFLKLCVERVLFLLNLVKNLGYVVSGCQIVTFDSFADFLILLMHLGKFSISSNILDSLVRRDKNFSFTQSKLKGEAFIWS
jgi:hypothetical protein